MTSRRQAGNVRVVAHRGASTVAPENTLPAFYAAVARKAQSIELDVHFTLDRKLVVIHDYDVERTTNGSGLLFELESDYVRSLDAGSWFGCQFSRVRVPFLDEVLDIPNVGFEIELKGSTQEFATALVASVRSRHLLDRVEFTSFHIPLLLRLKSDLPEARIGLFARSRPEWVSDGLYQHLVVGDATAGKFEVAHIPITYVTTSLVEQLANEGIWVHAADVNSPQDLDRAITAGVQQLSTDDMALVKPLIDRGRIDL